MVSDKPNETTSDNPILKVAWAVARISLDKIFFLFGAVLLLLGVTDTIDIGGLHGVVAQGYRWFVIGIGFLFILIAILIVYRPPRPRVIVSEPIPSSASSAVRPSDAQLSSTQRKILRLMAKYQTIELDKFEDDIRNSISKLGQASSGEIEYRVRYLHCVGFLTTTRIGQTSLYTLSDEYRKELESRFG
jgi:hypothetical protein